MARRNPPAKWVLPIVIKPATSTCWQVPVPDDLYHRAAFLGALLDLGSWYKWAEDPDHKAREVARVWRDIVDNLIKCQPVSIAQGDGITLEDALSSQIRISPDDTCIIQMWCIDHWEDWYDPRKCIATGSGQASSDGGQPAPGSTQQYCQTIEAVNPYLFPVQVNAGDVITASGMSGAWTDGVGGLISQWRCPDGDIYQLGSCNGSPTTEGTDPLPASNHMILLAFIDGVYYPLLSGVPFSVPFGVVNQNMLLVPNTGDTLIARGSISACITIQAAGALPVTVGYDFGDGPNQVTSGGTYQFNSDASGNPELYLTFNQQVKMTIVSSTLDTPTCGTYPCNYWSYYDDNVGSPFIIYAYPPTHPYDIPPTEGVRRWLINSGIGGAAFTVTVKIEF